MLNQITSAAGYLAVLLVPAFLLLGIAVDVPSLAFSMVIVVLPFLRPLTGKLQPSAIPLWTEPVATALDRLPFLYGAALTLTTGVVLRSVHESHILDAWKLLALGSSLWITMLFATGVVHELLHRRPMADALLGHYIAGLAGYPMFVHEHARHHARPGDTGSAEWPSFDESVWHFSARRAAAVIRSAYSPESAFWNIRARGRSVMALRVATTTFVMTWGLFAFAGGWRGATLYLCVSAAVTLGVQLFTYVQHWGLGEDRLGDRALNGVAWEDDCRLQSWMTLCITVHHAHHQAAHRPYYRIALSPDSPRLPAGYVALMFLCMVPRLWRKLMLPALEHWERNPDDPRSPGRHLTCFNHYSKHAARTVTR